MVKKVKYIGSSIWKYMTLNKIYDVVDEDFGEVKIVDDEGDECWFTKDNFKLAEETRKTLLEYFMELHDLKEGIKMNKRKTKKKHKYIVENIQKFKLDEDETLVIKFDRNKWSRDDISRSYEFIQKELTWRVIFVPKEARIIYFRDEED